MKRFKKMMALVIALVMTMMYVVPMTALASEGTGASTGTGNAGTTTYSITINKDTTDKAAHTYGAFEIFKGDLSVAGTTKTLSNVQWGDNVNPTIAITELKKITQFNSLANDASPAVVAKAISDASLQNDGTVAQAIADAFNKALTGNAKETVTIAAGTSSGVISGLSAGYYLVKDTAAVTGEGAQTRYILQVVDNVEVTEKASVPTVEKKVQDKNDSTSTNAESVTVDGSQTTWQDSADYDIGDFIPYKLTGTLPSKFDEYDTYKVYTFTDTLSAGLTPPSANSITVKVGDTDVTNHFNVEITSGTNSSNVITISLKSTEDLKTWTSPSLTKDSKFVVEYTATLNENAVVGSAGNPNTVNLQYTNNPNGEQDGDKGTTPDDKVIVFTYKAVVNKVEPDSGNATKPLSGAGFTLYKKVTAGTTGAQTGRALKDAITNSSVEKSKLSDTDYYVVVTKATESTATTFSYIGLDDGTYVLVETTIPAGYNAFKSISFEISATHDSNSADPKLLTFMGQTADNADHSITIDGQTANVNNGTITTNILNESGAVLPSTGGIGTTMFYLIGAILVIGAGVILVTRRRVEGQK